MPPDFAQFGLITSSGCSESSSAAGGRRPLCCQGLDTILCLSFEDISLDLITCSDKWVKWIYSFFFFFCRLKEAQLSVKRLTGEKKVETRKTNPNSLVNLDFDRMGQKYFKIQKRNVYVLNQRCSINRRNDSGRKKQTSPCPPERPSRVGTNQRVS